MSTYSMIAYLFINIFSVYLYARAFEVFFKRRCNIYIYTLVYLAFLIVNSVLHLVYLNMRLNIIVNLFFFTVVSFLYKGKILLRFIVAFLIYASFFAIESIVGGTFNIFYKDIIEAGNSIVLITAMVASRILCYVTLLIISWNRNSSDINIIKKPRIIIIFVMCIIMLVYSYMLPIYSHDVLFVLICSITLCVVSVLAFGFIELYAKAANAKLDKEVFEVQVSAYSNEIKKVSDVYSSIRQVKHSIKAELDVIYEKLESGKLEEAKRYLNEAYGYVQNVERLVATKNVDLNSLLNYKLSQAKNVDITIDLKLRIDGEININSHELVVLIGNLIDNAIEAVRNLKKENRHIELIIALAKSIFYIKVKNLFEGLVIENKGVLKTTKRNKNDHGYGIAHVKRIVDKYEGSLSIDYDDYFIVEVTLYNPIKN